MKLNTKTELRPHRELETPLQQQQKATTGRETSLTQTENPDWYRSSPPVAFASKIAHPPIATSLLACNSPSPPLQTAVAVAMMVKEEEIMAEAGGGRGYMDLLGLGEEDYLLCLSPPSYFTPSVVPATATTTAAASASTCCAASYLDLDLAPAYHHTLSFGGQDQEQQHHGDDGALGFQHYGGDHAIPAAAAAVQQKSSPTTECSSSLSSMSPSPPATAVSAAVSCPKPQAFKVRSFSAWAIS